MPSTSFNCASARPCYAASVAVAEMGGRVAKKLGDGLMSLFAYPLAFSSTDQGGGGKRRGSGLSIIALIADPRLQATQGQRCDADP